MEVTREVFQKLLHDNNERIYWRSAEAPKDTVLHRWFMVDSDKLAAMEVQNAAGATYYVIEYLLK